MFGAGGFWAFAKLGLRWPVELLPIRLPVVNKSINYVRTLTIEPYPRVTIIELENFNLRKTKLEP